MVSARRSSGLSYKNRDKTGDIFVTFVWNSAKVRVRDNPILGENSRSFAVAN
jgi:hypothetical protein